MDADDAKDHKWDPTDQTDELLGLEVSGKAGLKKDDKEKKAYMAYPIVSSDSSIVWVFSVGGVASRPWVQITSVTSPSAYIGDLYDSPGGSVEEAGITISVYGAESNEYTVGYAAFADKSEDSSGNEVYYIDGYLLG